MMLKRFWMTLPLVSCMLGAVACGDPEGNASTPPSSTSAATPRSTVAPIEPTIPASSTAVPTSTTAPTSSNVPMTTAPATEPVASDVSTTAAPANSTVVDTSPPVASEFGRIDAESPWYDLVGIDISMNSTPSEQSELPTLLGLDGQFTHSGTAIIGSPPDSVWYLVSLVSTDLPNVELYLLGSDTSESSGALSMQVVHVLDVHMQDDLFSSFGEIGCLLDGQMNREVLALLPGSSEPGSNAAAVEAWRFSGNGIETLDPGRVECLLAS